MPKDKGGNPNLIAKSPNPSQASSGYHNLEDLGITYKQSHQWQKIAKMSETV